MFLFNFSKTEINFDQWLEFLSDLCEEKRLDLEKTKECLTNCGIPGQIPVVVPAFREYFLTYKRKEKMVL